MMNVKIMSLLCLKCVHVIYVYYVQHLYVNIIIIMFKICQEHVNIIFFREQKQNKKICEDENISLYFIKTKIKICYIYREEKLI